MYIIELTIFPHNRIECVVFLLFDENNEKPIEIYVGGTNNDLLDYRRMLNDDYSLNQLLYNCLKIDLCTRCVYTRNDKYKYDVENEEENKIIDSIMMITPEKE